MYGSQKPLDRSEGPERDMISLCDGMGSGWAGKFFCHRRRRRPPKMCVLLENGLLRKSVKNERSRCDCAGILITQTLHIFFALSSEVFLVRLSSRQGRRPWPWPIRPMGPGGPSGPWAHLALGPGALPMSASRGEGDHKWSKNKVVRMRFSIVENVCTYSDIVLDISRDLQLPCSENICSPYVY